MQANTDSEPQYDNTMSAKAQTISLRPLNAEHRILNIVVAEMCVTGPVQRAVSAAPTARQHQRIQLRI